MRVLALDFGSARCGCAVSDMTGTIATPIEAVSDPASEGGITRLAELVGELGVERVVVGLPVSLSGEEGAQADEVKKFIDMLKDRVSVEVETLDERFTTVLAKQTQKDTAQAGVPAKATEDSIAAAHLLTGYLQAKRGN